MTAPQVTNPAALISQTAEPAIHPGGLSSIPGDMAATLRIPVIVEAISVDKRVVETGEVRLIKTVQEVPQTIEIPLLSEHIDIERLPMDQLVEVPPVTRQEGDTTIYPVVTEEYVVVKRLRLVEEIRITRRQVQTTEQQTISFRQETVVVKRNAITPTNERSDSPAESSL